MTDRPLPAELDALSSDAKAIAGGHMALMRPGHGEMVFRTPSRITARAKAALDELVAAGLVTCEPADPVGIVYRPQVSMFPLMGWLMHNEGAGRFRTVEGPEDATVTMTGEKRALRAATRAVAPGGRARKPHPGDTPMNRGALAELKERLEKATGRRTE